eukprot:128568_1
MGSVLTWTQLSEDDDSTAPIVSFGRSLSKPICQYIKKQCNQYNIILYSDIINIVQMYIGFVLESTILSKNEQAHLYKTLLEYHIDANVQSPLTESTSIKYFEPLFQGNLHKPKDADFDCRKFLTTCKDKQNLIMVFQTEFDHVFALYVRDKFTFTSLKADANNPVINVTVILLRSRFVYGDKTRNVHLASKSWPRIGRLNEGKHMNDVRLHAICFPGKKSGWFSAGDMMIMPGKRFKSLLKASPSLDFVGNELCGGDQFNPLQIDYQFRIKDVELFRLLS